MSALLLLTLLLGAEPACRTDDDCVLATACSCACCPELPRAVTRTEAERVLRQCATLGVCPNRSCPEVECRQPDGLVRAACRNSECVEVTKAVTGACVADVDCTAGAPGAQRVCRAGRCADKEMPVRPKECVSDADCTMAHDCGCGCCPSPTVPMTKQAALEVRQKCARLGPCGRDPKQCEGETCVPDVPGTAVCQANQCVRAPRQRPVLDAGVR